MATAARDPNDARTPYESHDGAEPDEPIPGERDTGTSVPLSRPFGEGLERMKLEDTMDAETRSEHAREGGGGAKEKRRG